MAVISSNLQKFEKAAEIFEQVQEGEGRRDVDERGWVRGDGMCGVGWMGE